LAALLVNVSIATVNLLHIRFIRFFTSVTRAMIWIKGYGEVPVWIKW